MPCWQIEVTSGGRIWYLLDTDKRTVWVTFAGTAHPRPTVLEPAHQPAHRQQFAPFEYDFYHALTDRHGLIDAFRC